MGLLPLRTAPGPKQRPGSGASTICVYPLALSVERAFGWDVLSFEWAGLCFHPLQGYSVAVSTKAGRTPLLPLYALLLLRLPSVFT